MLKRSNNDCTDSGEATGCIESTCAFSGLPFRTTHRHVKRTTWHPQLLSRRALSILLLPSLPVYSRIQPYPALPCPAQLSSPLLPTPLPLLLFKSPNTCIACSINIHIRHCFLHSNTHPRTPALARRRSARDDELRAVSTFLEVAESWRWRTKANPRYCGPSERGENVSVTEGAS